MMPRRAFVLAEIEAPPGPAAAMKLTVWTYEGPPHVGAMRVATGMKGCTMCCTRRRATPMPICCSP
jgi:hypothetical protein